MSSSKPSLEQRAAELASELIYGNKAAIPTEAMTPAHRRVTAAILSFAESVAAESAPRWIPVGERLPEYGQDCLVVAAGAVQFMAMKWNGKAFEWADGFEYGESAFDPFPSEVATHWQPLPAAPTEEA